MLADAEPLEVTVNDPGAPLVPKGVDVLDLAPVTAQAELDGLNQSTAFAGSPDFGGFIDSLPGTVDGLLSGTGPPLPVVPGSVSSSSNKPSQTETLGPYEISAKTSTVNSAALAMEGASASTGVSGVSANAVSAMNPDCSVTSTAASHISLVNLGALGNLGDISTVTTVTEQPGGQPTVSTSLTLGTITLPILGTIGLTNQGLTIAGLTVPSPVQTLLAALTTALGPSVNLQYMPATKTTQLEHNGNTSSVGVESAALKMTYTANVPTQGNVPVSLILGRTFVTVNNGATLPLPSASSGTGTAGDSGVGSTSTLPSSLLPSSLGSTDFGSTPSVPGTASTGSNPTTGTPSQALPAPSQVVSRVAGPSGEGVYLFLVLGAIAACGGAQLLRLLAVRMAMGRR